MWIGTVVGIVETKIGLGFEPGFLGLAGLLAATPSFAGGPLANCQSGQPFLWANGGSNITFNPDQGNLGPVNGPAAVALVGSAFQVWQDVPSATMAYATGSWAPAA